MTFTGYWKNISDPSDIIHLNYLGGDYYKLSFNYQASNKNFNNDETISMFFDAGKETAHIGVQSQKFQGCSVMSIKSLSRINFCGITYERTEL